ncbi:MAG TPA: amidohydrolase family protein [Bacteroidia bacterium]|nr:amidohydrolase family protein [Bacteroidia bacterium]
MKKLIFLYSLFTIHYSLCFAQQPIPAKPESKSILLINGTVHIGNGNVIQKGFIGIKNGKITEVGDATSAKASNEYDTTIDCNNKQIYPGLIGVDCTLGLVETESVRAQIDVEDVGEFNPELRSLVAYNTDSKITPVVRMNGVLTAQITPRGGIISGTSSVMSLDGWNWEDAAYKMDDGIQLNWPTLYRRIRINEDELGGYVENKNYEKEVQFLQKFLSDAQAYSQIKKHNEVNVKMEAMRGIFDGSKTLFIHADFAKEILAAITEVKGLSIPKIVLVGGTDSWMLTDFLKQNNIPVVIKRLHSQPTMPDGDVDATYKLPYQLQKAGILFCLDNSGEMEQNETRNLPFLAGTAVTYGLTQEQAIQAITYNAAKILGLDAQTGTLEQGKDATLIISDGDALDMRTNNIIWAFIKGRSIQLTSVQTALYNKYKDKYGLK